VRYGGETVNVVSGHEGDFEATFRPKPPKTFEVGIENADASAPGAKGGTVPVEVLAVDAPYFVVSDFDDTVAVSEVLDKGKLLTNALLRDESTQLAVKGMPAFYGCLRDQPGRPAFALVSGSPVQFAPRIAAFLMKNLYPPMGLYLRELSPGTLSNYKQPVIRVLMKALPNPAVYVGDSGEHDPEVYKQMNAEFPDRVKRIYIRNAGHAEDPKRFEGMFFFNDPKEAALDAVAHGLASKECVSKAFP
jgi:phosphatidate phosphatase APP1